MLPTRGSAATEEEAHSQWHLKNSIHYNTYRKMYEWEWLSSQQGRYMWPISIITSSEICAFLIDMIEIDGCSHISYEVSF